MINAIGKLTSTTFEFVGANETPKLTIELSCEGSVVPVTFIGDKALNALALLGDPGYGAGTVVPGTVLSVTCEPGFRFWEGNEEQAAKTFTTELQGLDVLVLGTVGPEQAGFYFQGVLHDYKEVQAEGKSGGYTRRTALLAVAVHKKGEILPGASLEMNISADIARPAQEAMGQLVILRGKVASFEWTPKKGKNVGVPQRSIKYTAESIISLNKPGWITAHSAFQVANTVAPTPVLAAAPIPAALSGMDTPLF